MNNNLLIEEICKLVIKHNHGGISIPTLINKTTDYVNNINDEITFLDLQQTLLNAEFTRWMP